MKKEKIKWLSNKEFLNKMPWAQVFFYIVGAIKIRQKYTLGKYVGVLVLRKWHPVSLLFFFIMFVAVLVVSGVMGMRGGCVGLYASFKGGILDEVSVRKELEYEQ